MTLRLAAPLALLALACGASAAAAADPEAPVAATDESAAKPDKQRKVCRRETETGSVMPKRICRTIAQMEEDQRRAERYRQQQSGIGGSAR